jgi:hypothetical protein
MGLEKQIKDLIFFYVRTNYDNYLTENNIRTIPDNEITSVITALYSERKEHIQKFIKESLIKLYENSMDKYPGDLVILNILTDIFSDDNLCINRIVKEINLYQNKNK